MGIKGKCGIASFFKENIITRYGQVCRSAGESRGFNKAGLPKLPCVANSFSSVNINTSVNIRGSMLMSHDLQNGPRLSEFY